MIEVKNVNKNFGEKQVLSEAALTVADGSVFGLVGINGAGKSTLLRLIAGVLKPDGGSVEIGGENVFENEKVKRRVFFLQDDPYFTPNLTGEAQAEFYKTFYNFDDKIFRRYAEIFKLDMKKPLRNFSKGMKRQTFVSLALACKPDYLLLDEAFDGLDPLARLEFKRGLIELQEGGSSVMIASHSLRELEDICDSFALLDDRSVKSYGNIGNELARLSKFQLAFKHGIGREDFPFECLHYEKTGRVIRLVARGDKDEIRAAIEKLEPVILDEIPMDFEDLFIYEAGERGYLK